MKKKILIPIDFKVESLNTLKLAIEENTGTDIHAVLMYGALLSTSITDLLFYSQRDILKSLLNPDFEQAIAILKNRYENNLKTVEIKLMHGNNPAAMDRFLKSYHIDEIFLPMSYILQPEKGGFNPLQLLKQSGIPVFEIDWVKIHNATNHLDLLFTVKR